jgi:SAM-dependent methyltransferase
MRYKAIPQNLPERFALWTGMVPMPMVDSLFPLVKTRALMAGARLGIFEALRESPRDAASLAERLGLEAESLELMLRVLAASGYLACRRKRFGLTAMARKTMLKDSPMDSRGYVEFNYLQWEFLDRLEDLIRTGRGLDFHRTMRDTRDWESYQRGMLEIARLHAPLLAKRVPVPEGARRLLDIAGSHGLLGAAICRRHPPLRSTVIELPRALEAARSLAKEAGISDIAAHRPGDILEPGFGLEGEEERDWDVALLANILHHFSPGENQVILERVRDIMAPGGTLAIWDIERPEAGKPPELGRDASALLFRLTSTSRCFSAEDYRAWLSKAGFAAIRTVRPMTAPLHFLIHARKAA